MSVNRVTLLGNVGQDPRINTTESGRKVAMLSLATSEKGYAKQDGTQVPERTEWHNIVVWGGLAEVVEKYVKKGSKLYIEGKNRTRMYEGADGVKRYTTEVYADSFEMLGSNTPSTRSLPPDPHEASPRFDNQSPVDISPRPDDLPF